MKYFVRLFVTVILLSILGVLFFLIMRLIIGESIGIDFLVLTLRNLFFLLLTMFIINLVVVKSLTGSYKNIDPCQSFSLNTGDRFMLSEAIQKIKVEQKKWHLINEEDNNVTIKTNISGIRSFGEKISIKTIKNNQGIIEIEIQSIPLLSFTIFDFGKGYQNIEAVKKTLINKL